MAVAGVGILPGTMQTAIIRQNRLELTPETAGSVGLTDGGAARLIVADGHLVVEPAGQDVQLLGLHVPLRLDVLESLGWRSGDVVGVEPAGQKLNVSRGLPTPTIRHSRPRARTALRCRRTGSYRL